MTRLFAPRRGRHARGSNTTGWGELARYCDEASRHPVVEPPISHPCSDLPRIHPYAERTAR